MKVLLPLLTLSSILALNAVACDCGKAKTRVAASTAAETNAEPKTHPVKGMVMGIMTEKTALLVKHEEVPGVMRAMTMVFKVEPPVLKTVKQGDAIRALMSRRADGWWLTNVEVVTAGK
jgi:Cu/Ag efflux protein CusF